jgi:hypothetical protein
MLPQLSSISAISRIIPTDGSRPVVILAEDLEEYACKYDSSTKLINEYLGHQFLKLWGLLTFPAAFIQIKREHIPTRFLGGRIQVNMFEKPSFGLRYDNDAGEINEALLGLRGDSYELGKFTNRYDLMNIALFDLWLANDDRNHNYNLLTRGTNFVPIDHSNIFYGNRLGSDLCQLTVEDSILTTDLAITFLNNKQKREDRHAQLVQRFPTFVANCRQALPQLIEDIPDEWCNDKARLEHNIISSVMDNDLWLKQTIFSFSELIHNFNR